MSDSTPVKTGNSFVKKISSILLTAAVILSVSVAAAPVWAVTEMKDYNPYATESDFTISNLAELEKLADLVNAGTDDFTGDTITLTGNVTIPSSSTWTPIGGGANSYAFAGSFIGGNYEITGLNIPNGSGSNFGLFGIIAAGGRVENLKLEEVTIATNASNVGGVAGNNAGTIEGCTVSAVGISGSANVGGIAGSNTGTGFSKNKITAGNITGTDPNSTGALVGTNGGTIDSTNFATTAVKVNGAAVDNNNLVGSGSTGTNDAKVTNPPSILEEAAGVSGCDAGFGFAGGIALLGAGLLYRRKRQ
jgi:hypothetical protein